MQRAGMRETAFGPLRPLAFVALGQCVVDCAACRVPPRRAGNFHLEAQMKVTKAKGLNATPLPRSARCGTPIQRATWTQCDTSTPRRTRRRGLRKASPAEGQWTQGRREARHRRASCRFDWRRCLQVARRADPPKREERAEWFCIQPLCFGDFRLRPQMKVIRPPCRDPAGWQSISSTEARRSQRPQRAAIRLVPQGHQGAPAWPWQQQTQ
jgi:hypothetical protein